MLLLYVSLHNIAISSVWAVGFEDDSYHFSRVNHKGV